MSLSSLPYLNLIHSPPIFLILLFLPLHRPATDRLPAVVSLRAGYPPRPGKAIGVHGDDGATRPPPPPSVARHRSRRRGQQGSARPGPASPTSMETEPLPDLLSVAGAVPPPSPSAAPPVAELPLRPGKAPTPPKPTSMEAAAPSDLLPCESGGG
jgi:hypothetical protein